MTFSAGPSDLLCVRATVNAHKALNSAEVTTAVRAAFDKLKLDTGLSDRNFSEFDRMALHVMFVEGARFGTEKALTVAKDTLMAEDRL